MNTNAMSYATIGQGQDQSDAYLAHSSVDKTMPHMPTGISQEFKRSVSNVSNYSSQQGLTQERMIDSSIHVPNNFVLSQLNQNHSFSRPKDQSCTYSAQMKPMSRKEVDGLDSFSSILNNNFTSSVQEKSANKQVQLNQISGLPYLQQNMTKSRINHVQMADDSLRYDEKSIELSSVPAYSPTPIQRPHLGQGKPMNEDDSMVEND